MATLNVYKVNLDGGKPSFVPASAGGDDFANSGKTFLIVKNGGAGAVTVTINSQTPCNYGFDHDVQVPVAAGDETWIGPFSKARFNDENGKVQISYSDITSVTVAAVEVG
jgi:hypothetical protein